MSSSERMVRVETGKRKKNWPIAMSLAPGWLIPARGLLVYHDQARGGFRPAGPTWGRIGGWEPGTRLDPLANPACSIYSAPLVSQNWLAVMARDAPDAFAPLPTGV